MFVSLLRLSAETNTATGSCIRGDNGKGAFYPYSKDGADAYAIFKDGISSTGWATMRISTSNESSAENQMYCAGYLDAYLAAERIYQAYFLFREENDAVAKWPAGWEDWINQNIKYIREKTANPTTDYWKKMKLIVAQFDGMVDALADAKPNGKDPISATDFWIFQSAGDFDDLETVINGQETKSPELKMKCTGMFKFAPNYSDVYFAQNTWSDYRDLLAYLKEYHFAIPDFKAKHITLSTRMGHINSDDDYWQADTGLFVLETTMHCWNSTLYKAVVPQSVLTWMRVYYAMLTADSGREWTENFIIENSGTYNNEYIILDTKKFTAGEEPKSDLLWMIEQYPTVYHADDITALFVNQSWWPSVNTPYFQDMYDIANYTGQNSSYWTYFEQPRYLVIKKHESDIVDFASFQTFMRHNDYLNPDEPNFGEPAQGVEARYDLRPENGTIYGARNHFGGLDSKCGSVLRFREGLSFAAINSPQYETLPAFTFDDWPQISHDGLPSKWTFPWQEFYALDLKCNTTNKEDECIKIDGCGFCLYSQQCMPALDKDGPAHGYKCEDGWKVYTETPAYAVPLVISVSVIVVAFVIFIYISAYFMYKKEKNAPPSYDQIK